MPPSSANSSPKGYLVKEFQSIIAWVILNHINVKNSMKAKAMECRFHNLFHGVSSDPKNIPFVKQCAQGLSVFKHLVIPAPTDQQRLTKSPPGPLQLQIRPELIPGATEPMYIGLGPSADIRLVHLEAANVTHLGTERNALISGRTLLRMAKQVSAVLKKVHPIVMECLGPDGEFPSGTNQDDLFKELIKKLMNRKSKGLFVEGTPEDEAPSSNQETSDPTVATLTQGTQAVASAIQKNTKDKWTYKYIPIAGWFAIALFCQNGIARKSVEDLLPLLKFKDYEGNEKKKHSRSAARKEEAASKARSRGGWKRVDLALGGVNTRDHLLASIVGLLADSNSANQEMDSLARQKDRYRFLQQSIKGLQWRIDHSVQLDEDCSRLIQELGDKMKEAEEVRLGMNKIMDQQDKDDRSAMKDTNERARKVAKLVDDSLQADSDKPATVTIDCSKSLGSESQDETTKSTDKDDCSTNGNTSQVESHPV